MRILYMDCFLGFDAQMLLGALIDAGASVEIIRKDFENAGISADISISNTLRCSISCKRAEVITDSKPESYFVDNPMISSIFKDFEITPGTDPVTVMAVIFATEQLGIDYIISSDISLPENTDGRVLELLESANIEISPSDGSTRSMEPADAAFLIRISNENGPKPSMEILSIGYGAGGEKPDSADIITAIIGESEADNLFEAEESESILAYL